MKESLDDLCREADAFLEKGDADTSPYRVKTLAKRSANGCEVCERGLVNVFGDFVDGMHRLAGATQKNMRLLEREEQLLELAARSHIDGATKETAAELTDALCRWLRALEVSRGEQ